MLPALMWKASKGVTRAATLARLTLAASANAYVTAEPPAANTGAVQPTARSAVASRMTARGLTRTSSTKIICGTPFKRRLATGSSATFAECGACTRGGGPNDRRGEQGEKFGGFHCAEQNRTAEEAIVHAHL